MAMAIRSKRLILIIAVKIPNKTLSNIVRLGARFRRRDKTINCLRRAIFSAATARIPPGRNNLTQTLTKLNIMFIDLIILGSIAKKQNEIFKTYVIVFIRKLRFCDGHGKSPELYAGSSNGTISQSW